MYFPKKMTTGNLENGKMTILDYPCIAILGFHVFLRCVGSPTKIGKLKNEEQDGTVDSADSLPHNSGSEWPLCSESLFGRIMNLVSIFVRILLVYNNIVACKKALNLKIPVLRLDFAVPGRLALTNDSCWPKNITILPPKMGLQMAVA